MRAQRQAPSSCALKPLVAPRGQAEAASNTHSFGQFNLFRTCSHIESPRTSPSTAAPGPFPFKELGHPGASGFRTGRVGSSMRPVGQDLKAAHHALWVFPPASSPPRFGTGCVWPALGKDVVMCAEMPRGHGMGVVCARNSLFVRRNESGTWLLLVLGAEGGPQQDELPSLALVIQRPQVQRAGTGCVHSLRTTQHRASGTTWQRGPKPRAPLSELTPCNFQLLSCPAPLYLELGRHSVNQTSPPTSSLPSFGF